jgi:hypothetical protein
MAARGREAHGVFRLLRSNYPLEAEHWLPEKFRKTSASVARAPPIRMHGQWPNTAANNAPLPHMRLFAAATPELDCAAALTAILLLCLLSLASITLPNKFWHSDSN